MSREEVQFKTPAELTNIELEQKVNEIGVVIDELDALDPETLTPEQQQTFLAHLDIGIMLEWEQIHRCMVQLQAHVGSSRSEEPEGSR